MCPDGLAGIDRRGHVGCYLKYDTNIAVFQARNQILKPFSLALCARCAVPRSGGTAKR